MSDFFERRDMASVTAFTDAGSKFIFNFESSEQLVHNDSVETVEVSFDGQDVHARLQPSGPSKVINWSGHIRRVLWIRRTGVGGGSKFVEVIASTV